MSRSVPRLSRSNPQRALLAIAALAAALAGTAPAQADYSEVEVASVGTEYITVLSNGSSYTEVPWNANVVADLHVVLDGGVSGRVKNWKIWLGLEPPGWAAIQFPHYGVSKSYPFGKRPKSVDRTETVIVPAVAFRDFAVFHCNELADQLRQSGLSNQQIFGEDRSVELSVRPYVDVEFSGIEGWNPQEAVLGYPKIELRCQKWQGASFPTAGQFAPNFQVTEAKLFIAPAYRGLTAECPVTVPLVAEFTATNTGTVRFRFVSASGKVSQSYQTEIAKAGSLYKGQYEKQIQVPLTQASGMGGPGAGGGGGAGGASGAQAGGGFAVQTNPEDPFPTNPTPPTAGGNQVQAIPTPGNLHSESFRVEVLGQASEVVSSYVGYRITCKPKPAGIGGPEGLTVQQRNPQPSGGATTVIGGIKSAPSQPQPDQPTAPQRVAPVQPVVPPQPLQLQMAPQQ